MLTTAHLNVLVEGDLSAAQNKNIAIPERCILEISGSGKQDVGDLDHKRIVGLSRQNTNVMFGRTLLPGTNIRRLRAG